MSTSNEEAQLRWVALSAISTQVQVSILGLSKVYWAYHPFRWWQNEDRACLVTKHRKFLGCLATQPGQWLRTPWPLVTWMEIDTVVRGPQVGCCAEEFSCIKSKRLKKSTYFFLISSWWFYNELKLHIFSKFELSFL